MFGIFEDQNRMAATNLILGLKNQAGQTNSKNHTVKHFLPCNINNDINLLAVWTHRNNSVAGASLQLVPNEQIRINRYLQRFTPKICDELYILCIAFDFINCPFFVQIISIVMNFKFVKYWLFYFQEAFSMLIHYNGY